MTITDFEHARKVKDLSITLTRDEAEELARKLQAMLTATNTVAQFHSECGLNELTIRLMEGEATV